MTEEEARKILNENWWKFNKYLHNEYQNYEIKIGDVVKEEIDRFIFFVKVKKDKKKHNITGDFVVFKDGSGCRPAIFFDGSGE